MHYMNMIFLKGFSNMNYTIILHCTDELCGLQVLFRTNIENPPKNSLGIFRNAQEISMAIAIQSNKKVLKY